MKQEIQDKNMQERQAYASPKVKVITTSVQRVICISPNGINPMDPDEEDGGSLFG